MNNFHFSLKTEIFAGRGAVRKQCHAWLLGRRALIVTGRTSAKLSGALADVCDVLDLHHIPYAIYDGVNENPDVSQVYGGVAVALAHQADFVIAIGGGSPMDAAKSIAWAAASMIAQEDFFERKPTPRDAVLPIVAIPTTCGTGSEVTPYSIITHHVHMTKVNVSSPRFFPTIALLDARYLESMPKHVLCDTALDALSHAIEGAYSPRANRFTLAISEEAIGILIPELIRLAHGAFVNLAQLQYASLLAGIVIAQAGTGLVHAMGYPLTCHKGIPHGRANGTLLAGYMDYMSDACEPLTQRLFDAANLQGPDELQALIDQLLETIHCSREAPTEEELLRFSHDPLRLELVQRYRTMPSMENVMDIYRTGF
jgi:alcohol dehydrogenase class IV